MKKRKNARITLEVTLGIVFSIILFVAVVWIVVGLVRPTEASKNSFYNLVSLIEKVDDSNPGTIKSMALRMDKDTAIVGFSSNCNQLEFHGMTKSPGYFLSKYYFFKKPFDYNCEKDKACICLCRKIEGDYEGDEIKCEEDQLFCETLDGIEFPECFFISRSHLFLEESYDLQLRTVYVEKYSEYGEDLVAICENLDGGSCVSQEYKEEKKAIYGLKKLKEFIESCKDREFAEDEEPCSCGSFDFTSEFPEKYIVEFTESDNGNLKLVLKHEDEKDETTSVEVDVPPCIFHPILKSLDYPEDESTIKDRPPLYNYYLDKDESIILEYNLPLLYTFYYKGNIEDKRIIFIKESDENICILRHSERGNIGLDTESPDTITFKPFSKIQRNIELGHPEIINIIGCGYSTPDEE